jgi:SAM-dependent methyltransferase
MLWQNARNLSSFANASLDFTYSISSIEHFGDEPAVGVGPAESVREQARVLKPGGIMFMAVDTVITGQGEAPGNGYTPAQLNAAIFRPAAAAGMQLVEPVFWGISPATLAAAEYIGVLGGAWKDECINTYPHVVFCQSMMQSPRRFFAPKPLHPNRPMRCITSLTLAFRKAADQLPFTG